MSDKFSIEFYTPELPAPFAFAIQLEAKNQNQNLQVSFTLQYIDRESCTREEILDEGFTGEDDISWSGTLNKTWTNAFDKILKKITTDKEESDNHIFIKQTNNASNETTGFTNNEDLEYLLKELHQAVLEELQLELPLSINIQEYTQEQKTLDFSCIASFLERKAVIISTTNDQCKETEINWADLVDFMATIYAHELEQDKAQEKLNQPKGLYIEMGNDLWIPVKGKAKDQIRDAVKKITNQR